MVNPAPPPGSASGPPTAADKAQSLMANLGALYAVGAPATTATPTPATTMAIPGSGGGSGPGLAGSGAALGGGGMGMGMGMGMGDALKRALNVLVHFPMVWYGVVFNNTASFALVDRHYPAVHKQACFVFPPSLPFGWMYVTATYLGFVERFCWCQ